tara:strand:+ start:1470 stop:2879 length:1410 start_codon:yes stop_codon:yes gene_type:complete
VTQDIFEAWAIPSSVVAPGATSDSAVAPELSIRSLSIESRWLNELTDILVEGSGRLKNRKATELARILGTVGSRFLKEGDPLRTKALELLPQASGLSVQMARVVLDGMAADWVEDRLLGLLENEFGTSEGLDGFVKQDGCRTMAIGADLCVQIVSGSVPGVGVTALIRSLLTKAPTLLKPGRGDVVLPVLFMQALAVVDQDLADHVAILYWSGGSSDLERGVLDRASVVTTYGGDESVESIRALTPVTKRFVAYHHRISVGVIGSQALTSGLVEQTARDVAYATAVFDQRGCVSPRSIYVESGGDTTPQAFAEYLASALESIENDLPGGHLELEEAAALHQVRGAAELLAVSGSPGGIYHGEKTSWTVIFDPDSKLRFDHVGRVVRVESIENLSDLIKRLRPDKEHIQSVGVAGMGTDLDEFAEELGRIGVSRIAKFSGLPFPPSRWHHDGGSPLRDLVHWVDLEEVGG